jgi:hypothetical protein
MSEIITTEGWKGSGPLSFQRKPIRSEKIDTQ